MQNNMTAFYNSRENGGFIRNGFSQLRKPIFPTIKYIL